MMAASSSSCIASLDDQNEGIAAIASASSVSDADTALIEQQEALFSSDNFRMYAYKVLPCAKRTSHEWTSCPFAHPGEKARRRDPRVYNYLAIPCEATKQGGTCPKGDSCPNCHSLFEYWLHPSRYRTQLCRNNDGSRCKRQICFFAHSIEELRVPDHSHLNIPAEMQQAGAAQTNSSSSSNSSTMTSADSAGSGASSSSSSDSTAGNTSRTSSSASSTSSSRAATSAKSSESASPPAARSTGSPTTTTAQSRRLGSPMGMSAAALRHTQSGQAAACGLPSMALPWAASSPQSPGNAASLTPGLSAHLVSALLLQQQQQQQQAFQAQQQQLAAAGAHAGSYNQQLQMAVAAAEAVQVQQAWLVAQQQQQQQQLMSRQASGQWLPYASPVAVANLSDVSRTPSSSSSPVAPEPASLLEAAASSSMFGAASQCYFVPPSLASSSPSPSPSSSRAFAAGGSSSSAAQQASVLRTLSWPVCSPSLQHQIGGSSAAAPTPAMNLLSADAAVQQLGGSSDALTCESRRAQEMNLAQWLACNSTSCSAAAAAAGDAAAPVSMPLQGLQMSTLQQLSASMDPLQQQVAAAAAALDTCQRGLSAPGSHAGFLFPQQQKQQEMSVGVGPLPSTGGNGESGHDALMSGVVNLLVQQLLQQQLMVA